MKVFLWILGAIIGYLLGSISISILLSKYVYRRDVRTAGSGNAGATNVARTFGMGAGFLTFLGDFAKTILSMFLGRLLGGEIGMCIAGAASLIGHCFPVFFRFRGGKGVSSAAAAMLMIDWRVFLIAITVFLIVAFSTKIASISSMSAAVAAAVSALLFPLAADLQILAVFAALLLIVMHHANIRRILLGTEPKFRPGHAEKPKKD